MKTVVVNKHKEPFDVYIGRPGPFGNPLILRREEERALVLERFRRWFLRNRALQELVWRELRGKRLGCFCKPRACHGDVYVEYINQRERQHA